MILDPLTGRIFFFFTPGNFWDKDYCEWYENLKILIWRYSELRSWRNIWQRKGTCSPPKNSILIQRFKFSTGRASAEHSKGTSFDNLYAYSMFWFNSNFLLNILRNFHLHALRLCSTCEIVLVMVGVVLVLVAVVMVVLVVVVYVVACYYCLFVSWISPISYSWSFSLIFKPFLRDC